MLHPFEARVSSTRGLTLIELLVTVSVLALLIGIALPSFDTVLSQWQRDRATRNLISHLQLARSNAIKTTRRIVMCSSLDSKTCTGSGDHDWSKGWLVFQDDNTNNTPDTSEPVIAVAGVQAGIQTMVSSNRVRRYVFNSTGLMAYGMSSLVVTPRTGPTATVVLSRVGRIRVSKSQNSG